MKKWSHAFLDSLIETAFVAISAVFVVQLTVVLFVLMLSYITGLPFGD